MRAPADRRQRDGIAALMSAGLIVCALSAPLPAWAVRCDVRIKADGDTAAIQRAMDVKSKRPAVICLQAGVYKGARLVASRSVTLRKLGRGRVVLDAGSRGRALTITEPGLTVTLASMVLTSGDADNGGAIALLADSRVRLQRCWLVGNRAQDKGGAIYANAGQVELLRSRIETNFAAKGGAILLTGTAKAEIKHCLVSDNKNRPGSNSPIWLDEGSRLDFRHSTVAYNIGHGIYLRPKPRGPTPRLRVESAIVAGGPNAISVARSRAGQVEVYNSVLYGAIGFISLDLESKRELARFDLTGSERYRPTTGSPAIQIGRCTTAASRRDLNGTRRARRCTAGALEASPANVRKTLKARANIKRNKRNKRKPTNWW